MFDRTDERDTPGLGDVGSACKNAPEDSKGRSIFMFSIKVPGSPVDDPLQDHSFISHFKKDYQRDGILVDRIINNDLVNLKVF